MISGIFPVFHMLQFCRGMAGSYEQTGVCVQTHHLPGKGICLLILVVQFGDMLKRRGSVNTDTVVAVLDLFPCQFPAFPEILCIHGAGV